VYISERHGLAHWCSKGLALTDRQRTDLMTLPTKSMAADRRQLAPGAAADLLLALLADAHAHPDRSGQRQPQAIANRRAHLWQTFILAGRSMTKTAQHWALITEEPISRQALAKQVDAVRRSRVVRSESLRLSP
jgi:hypothetical protein